MNETEPTIEFVQGNEKHSSTWGKFYIRGLESHQVQGEYPENSNNAHMSYQGYACLNLPSGRLFTIFEQSGNKNGTDTFVFSICEVRPECWGEYKPGYGLGWVKGKFHCLCSSKNSQVKGKRLMDWWLNAPEQTREYALLYEHYIHQKGVKKPPQLEVKHPGFDDFLD